ncbi:MAG: hypothetical protein QOE63_1069 [Acidimicrobiaceae bacterium]
MSDGRVRPYALTGGRTRPAVDHLPVEALVVASRDLHELPRYEAGRVCAVCTTPVAIAEVAAAMGLALGATRVLVGDLIASGALVLHGASAAAPDRVLLSRVLQGLEAL